jgi:hypothetical protein
MNYPSYEKYFTEQLKLINSRLSCYPYKNLTHEDGSTSSCPEDYHVKVFYTCPKDGKVELFSFVVTRGFWHSGIGNKKDYQWMLSHATPKLDMIKAGRK